MNFRKLAISVISAVSLMVGTESLALEVAKTAPSVCNKIPTPLQVLQMVDLSKEKNESLIKRYNEQMKISGMFFAPILRERMDAYKNLTPDQQMRYLEVMFFDLLTQKKWLESWEFARNRSGLYMKELNLGEVAFRIGLKGQIKDFEKTIEQVNGDKILSADYFYASGVGFRKGKQAALLVSQNFTRPSNELRAFKFGLEGNIEGYFNFAKLGKKNSGTTTVEFDDDIIGPSFIMGTVIGKQNEGLNKIVKIWRSKSHVAQVFDRLLGLIEISKSDQDFEIRNRLYKMLDDNWLRLRVKLLLAKSAQKGSNFKEILYLIKDQRSLDSNEVSFMLLLSLMLDPEYAKYVKPMVKHLNLHKIDAATFRKQFLFDPSMLMTFIFKSIRTQSQINAFKSLLNISTVPKSDYHTFISLAETVLRENKGRNTNPVFTRVLDGDISTVETALNTEKFIATKCYFVQPMLFFMVAPVVDD